MRGRERERDDKVDSGLGKAFELSKRNSDLKSQVKQVGDTLVYTVIFLSPRCFEDAQRRRCRRLSIGRMRHHNHC